MNNKIGRVVKAVSFLLVLAVLLPGCGNYTLRQTTQSTAKLVEPSAGWAISFSLPDGAPPLNQEAQLVATVDAETNIKIDDLKVWVILPAGLQLVSGNLTWEGPVTANAGDRIPTVKAVVRSVKEGNWELRVHGYLSPTEFPGITILPEGYPVFLAISKDGAEWSLNPPRGSPLPREPIPSNYPTPPTTQPEPSPPVQVRLSLSQPPPLNQPAVLTCNVFSTGNITGANANIRLPAAAALETGKLTWQGDLKAGEQVSFSAKIVFKEIGKWMIEASVGQIGKQDRYSYDLDTVYVNVGAQTSEFGWAPSPPKLSTARQGDGKIIALPADNATFSPPEYFKNIPPPPSISLDGVILKPTEEHHSITVVGDFYYWTGSGDYRDPENPNVLVSGRHFLVEIRGGDNSHRAWGYTDSNGHYSIPGVNPSGGLKARFFAYANYFDQELRVIYQGDSLTGVQDVYATGDTPTYQLPDDGGTYYLEDTILPQGFDGDGAFWIKDDLDRAYRLPSYLPGPGTVHWTETSQLGDFFYTPTALIYLKGEAEQRPDAVVHEYGHRVMYNWYNGVMPSGTGPDPHHFWDSSSQGFAWKEGWADFFALAVNGNKDYTYPGGVVYDLELPSWGYVDINGAWPDGDSVEGRVTGALWDLFDSAPDGYDQFQVPAINIWQVMATGSIEGTFLDFWNNLKGSVSLTPAARSLFQNTIAYSEIRLYLTTNVSPPFSGTVSKSPELTEYTRNQSVTLTANPAADRQFASWTGDLSSSNNPAAIVLDFDKTVTANFDWTPHYLAVTAGSGGTVTNPGIGTFGPYAHGQYVTLYAAPSSGYHFVSWVGQTGTITNPNAAGTSINMQGSYSIRADFAPDTYTLTIGSGAGGTVTTPSLGTFGPYAAGTVVNLVATPNASYHFVSWTGNTGTIANPNVASTTITMNSNYSIQANFEADAPTYTLTIASGAGGTVTTPGVGTFGPYTSGQVVNLVATPNASYHFVNWSGNTGAIANPNLASTTITMNGNYSIQANFAPDSPPPPTPPSVATNTATGVTSTSVMLNGSLTSLGTATSVAVSFEYGLTTSYGSTITASPSPMTSPGSFTASLTNLTPNTTYHFRAKGDGGSAGTGYGGDQVFTTSASGPTVIISINTSSPSGPTVIIFINTQ